MLLTLGGLGLWAFIDLILILLGKFKDRDGSTIANPKPVVSWAVFSIFVLVAGTNNNSPGGPSATAPLVGDWVVIPSQNMNLVNGRYLLKIAADGTMTTGLVSPRSSFDTTSRKWMKLEDKWRKSETRPQAVEALPDDILIGVWPKDQADQSRPADELILWSKSSPDTLSMGAYKYSRSTSNNAQSGATSPVGVFSGNAAMGPSTYYINADGTYRFVGVNRNTGVGEEVQGRGTWRLSGNTIIFNNQGIEMSWDLSSDGRRLGPSWVRQ